MAKSVVTPECLISYAYVFEPQKNEDGTAGKYSVNMIFKKNDPSIDLTDLKKAALAVAEEKFGSDFKKKMKVKFPFRDGDEDRPGAEEYANSIFLVARTNNQPKVVNERLERIMDRDEFYSGCIARCSLVPFAYDHKTGGKGVSFALNNIMKVRDGDRLSGSPNPEAEFAQFASKSSDSDIDSDFGI